MKSLARSARKVKDVTAPIEVSEKSISRFWGRVTRDLDGCWRWHGRTNQFGYGVIYLGRRAGKSVCALAHRYSYTYLVEAIPDGLVIDHLSECVTASIRST